MNTVGGVTPEVFKTEREVVRNELRQRWETTPGNRMFDLLFESLYPVEPPAAPADRRHARVADAPPAGARPGVREGALPSGQHHHHHRRRRDHRGGEAAAGHLAGRAAVRAGRAEGPTVEPRKRVGERPAPPVPPPVTTKLVRHKGPIDRPGAAAGLVAAPGLRGKDAMADFAASRLNWRWAAWTCGRRTTSWAPARFACPWPTRR